MSLRAPIWLLLGLLLPWWVARRRRRLSGEAVAFSPLQLSRPAGRGRRGLGRLVALEVLVLAGGVLSAAGPERQQIVPLYEAKGVDIALVLDISASMQAADMPPTRLEVLKQLASDFVRRGAGHRIGVYAFSGLCFTQTPLSTDTTATLELIDGLAYESIAHDSVSAGTAIGDALLVAVEDLARMRVAGRDQVVLLLTDGENNKGADPVLAGKNTRDHRVRFYAVGIGKDEPVPVFVYGKPYINSDDEQLTTRLHDQSLRELAEVAGGRYFRADTTGALSAIFDEIARLEQRPLQQRQVHTHISYRPQVALAILLLVALWLALDGLVLRRPIR